MRFFRPEVSKFEVYYPHGGKGWTDLRRFFVTPTFKPNFRAICFGVNLLERNAIISDSNSSVIFLSEPLAERTSLTTSLLSSGTIAHPSSSQLFIFPFSGLMLSPEPIPYISSFFGCHSRCHSCCHSRCPVKRDNITLQITE